MHTETERKFLVRKDLWYAIPKPEGEDIVQGYLVSEPHLTIRIRISETGATLTIKGASRNITRDEYEYRIPTDDARGLLGSLSGNRIEKTRFRMNYKGKTWEVDEFFGENEGLIIAEIELEREDETFTKPQWLGEEVTSDERYRNSNLALHPYKKW